MVTFWERFLSVSTSIAPTLLDSQLYTDQAEDTFSIQFWWQKAMYFSYAFLSPELGVGFARLWNFKIYCLPETKTDLSEVFLQLKANIPRCNAPWWNPARCKEIFLLSFWTLNICVALTGCEYLHFFGERIQCEAYSCRNCHELFVWVVNFLNGKQ